MLYPEAFDHVFVLRRAALIGRKLIVSKMGGLKKKKKKKKKKKTTVHTVGLPPAVTSETMSEAKEMSE
jgi:hypothetical protein